MELIILIVATVLITAAVIAALTLLPALVVMLAFNWIAPQFGGHVHLSFFQVWIGLFAVGVVARVLRSGSSSDSK